MQSNVSNSTKNNATGLLVTAGILFVVPIVIGMVANSSAPAGMEGESGWGALMAGIFMWPVALILGLIGLVRLFKGAGEPVEQPPEASPISTAAPIEPWKPGENPDSHTINESEKQI